MRIGFQNRSPRVRLPRRAEFGRRLERALEEARRTACPAPPGDGELTVALIGPRRMRRMNRQFLGHDAVTDVIAFDLGPGTGPDGPGGRAAELYVCPAQAVVNAGRFGTSAATEIVLCIVHGLLHLNGEDDREAPARRRMRRAERRVMRTLRSEFDLDRLLSVQP